MPRKQHSTGSAVNIKRAKELIDLGRMQPAGVEPFNKRDEKRARLYSYEQKHGKLDNEYAKKLKANKKAWMFFQSRASWYQKAAIWWVVSAKQEETRLSRLARLIEDSKHGQTIPALTRPKSQSNR
jgi:uncharacterized protein YdeI (YjbR/CyaY-like superfamily)